MRIALIFLVLFLGACGGKKTEVPKEVLPLPQMTNVLWDMMLADELASNNYPIDTTNIRMDTSLMLYSQVAQAHRTTQQQIKKSLQFYKTRPDLIKIILDTLNIRAVLPADTAAKPPLPVE